MMKRLDEKDLETRRPFEGGFTLIELLVVVIILGILAAVVVFSVGGVGTTGQESACKIDTKTVKTAEAAAFAKAREASGKGEYITEDQLVADDLLSDTSSLHNITLTPVTTPQVTGTAYAVVMTQKGAESCIPEGADVADCAPETTLPTAGSEVGICTDPGADAGTDDDVKYPF